ncbi:branched-chain amino acid ABC transporter permease [Aminobacter sp. MSH1]|uniref:branched-chain amino acid ABC transporter permease n=1 Tax=Aminobacter sp. MSH1 TaxID=374606 RepID=UPI000D342271|nr:branched-chain amino acid ABC transporter permease [Aminobacter sp. MSH1]
MQDLLYIAIRGLGAGALFGLIALAFNVVYKSSHIFNFAQGNLLIVAALGAYLVQPDGSGYFSWLFGLVLVCALVGVFVAVQGFVTLLPLRYAADQHSWLITTMAVSIMIGAVLLLAQGPSLFTVSSPFPPVPFFGMKVPSAFVFLILLVFAWYGFLRWFSRNTAAGLAISALSQDYEAARTAGIQVRRLQIVAFLISGLILGSAGYIAAPIVSISPEVGIRYVVNGFIAAVVGGIGSNDGALAGGAIVGIISALATYQIGGEYESSILLCVLILLLLIKPEGLFGRAAARRF